MYFYRRVLSYLNHEKTFTFFFFSVKKKHTSYVIHAVGVFHSSFAMGRISFLLSVNESLSKLLRKNY